MLCHAIPWQVVSLLYCINWVTRDPIMNPIIYNRECFKDKITRIWFKFKSLNSKKTKNESPTLKSSHLSLEGVCPRETCSSGCMSIFTLIRTAQKITYLLAYQLLSRKVCRKIIMNCEGEVVRQNKLFLISIKRITCGNGNN